MGSEAALPMSVLPSSRKAIDTALSVLSGVLFLSIFAQISIPLPWTPVPITGQTLAVTVTALLLGARGGFSVVLCYLILGSLGLPIFASGSSGLLLGPTFGYLIGMLASALIVGWLADLGFTRSLTKSLIAAYMGSIAVFSFGVLGLSFFIEQDSLLQAGVLPFLFGDAVKNCLAVLIARKIHRHTRPEALGE